MMSQSNEQLEFDFPRGRKLWILDQLAIHKLVSLRMLLTLRVIDNVARNGATAEVSHDEIASLLMRSRTTAKRGVRELEDEKFLIVERNFTWKGQAKNTYQIVWSNLHALVEDRSQNKNGVSPEKFRGAKIQRTPVQKKVDRGPENNAPRSTGGLPYISNRKEEYIITPPPITNHDLWKKVKLDLIKCEMGAWHGLMTQAQANGADPNRVLQLTQFFLQGSGRWQPGALYHRILNDHPETRIDQGWPGDSQKFKSKQKYHFEQSKRDQEVIANEKRKLDVENEKRKSEQLESEFGATLDSMNQNEQTSLAGQIGTFFLKRFRLDGIDDPSIRAKLLKQLSSNGSKELIHSKADQVPEDNRT